MKQVYARVQSHAVPSSAETQGKRCSYIRHCAAREEVQMYIMPIGQHSGNESVLSDAYTRSQRCAAGSYDAQARSEEFTVNVDTTNVVDPIKCR